MDDKTFSAEKSNATTTRAPSVDPNDETSSIRSPSGPDWSYDAKIRCLSENWNAFSDQKLVPLGQPLHASASLPILSLLNTQKLSLEPSPGVCTLGSPTTSHETLDSSTDHVISMESLDGTMKSNVDAANSTHMTAGIVLLCISGIMEAVTISYVIWLNQTGITTSEMLLYQGIVQVLLCFLFGLITATVMVKGGSMSHGLRRNASFRSLVLPFSSEYHEHFLSIVRFQKRKIMDSTAFPLNKVHHNKYGALSDLSNTMTTNGHKVTNYPSSKSKPTKDLKQLLVAVVVFGLIQFMSHLTFFNGYLDGEDGESHSSWSHLAIAPLFNSIAIICAFLWSYFFHQTAVNSELLSYLFLMYIGVAVCGYSFVMDGYDEGMALLTRKSNAFLVFSALLESVAYLLIKYAHRVPTFLLVFSQSLCCAALGAVMVSLSGDGLVPISSFSQFLEVTSVGVLGFWTTWTFVRGTQLISIGTASFLKMTIFMISSIAIQVFSFEGGMPHFYCVFGVCLIALSIVLMLIEKFSKFQK